MKTSTHLIFKGTSQEFTAQELLMRPEDSPKQAEPYVASEGLIQAVNLAMHVGRPLLLEGEAGCGKTRLARALAYELGVALYTWQVRSTSKAVEGLYSYDAILRLHDVQVRQLQGNGNVPESTTLRNPGDPKDYRNLGPLGKAFVSKEFPAVVLIDEIDKADVDFPNDLLAVLDEPWEFLIQETGEKIKAEHKPIIIITSNKEKGNLPFPFLRRCVYYYVEFPSEPTLKSIVEEHYKNQPTKPSTELIQSAVQRFIEIRQIGNLLKSPSTSEFLDWVEALNSFNLKNNHLIVNEVLPYPSLLFKLRPDWNRYCKTA